MQGNHPLTKARTWFVSGSHGGLLAALLIVALFLGATGGSQSQPPAPKPLTATGARACELLTKAEVLEALKASEAKNPGKPSTIRVEKAEESETWDGAKECLYSYSLVGSNGDKWDYGIRVSYRRDPSALDEFKEIKGKIGRTDYPVERVPGLGEEAYWVEEVRLYVWSKGGLLKIDHGFRWKQKDLSIRLAKRALERIR